MPTGDLSVARYGRISVPKMCPRHAYLPLLACLTKPKVNNLRLINTALKNDPPSRHQDKKVLIQFGLSNQERPDPLWTGSARDIF
jgi:hypothetical protein